MTDESITYRAGYNYQLVDDYHATTRIKPKKAYDGRFIALDKEGKLTVKSGYAWDGVSGPVIDTDMNLRASLVHDALYQLMRNRVLSSRDHKNKADKLFKKMCREDGVPSPMAKMYYEALKLLGKPSTDPGQVKPPLRSPRSAT